jgi:hypothetical protein
MIRASAPALLQHLYSASGGSCLEAAAARTKAAENNQALRISPALLQYLHPAPCCCRLEAAAEHVHQLGVRLWCVKRGNLHSTKA